MHRHAQPHQSSELGSKLVLEHPQRPPFLGVYVLRVKTVTKRESSLVIFIIVLKCLYLKMRHKYLVLIGLTTIKSKHLQIKVQNKQKIPNEMY